MSEQISEIGIEDPTALTTPQTRTARLLVSVRNVAEATLAAAWADVVDIKDPTRGALGAADPMLWSQVLNVVTDKPVTLALGEADDWASETIPSVPAGVAAVKLGPGASGRTERVRACRRLFEEAAGRSLPWVAVAYADRPFDVDEWLCQAAEDGCVAALVDTCDKSGARLTDVWTIDQMNRYRERANGFGLLLVLAGRISRESLPELVHAADLVGLRSAACDAEDRTLGICENGLRLCRRALESACEAGIS